MQFLIVILLVLGGGFTGGLALRKVFVNGKVNREALALHDYVLDKCQRSGCDKQEAEQIAKNYQADFEKEFTRRWRRIKKGGNLFVIFRNIGDLADDFHTEIDGRFR